MKLANNLRLVRRHLHAGNSSRSERRGHPYVTVSRILDTEDNELARGVAICSRKDQPSRKVGRMLADGRALEAYHHVSV